MDYYLRPIVEKGDSFIKDTTHFLQTLFGINSNDIPKDLWLVTLDVKSLYTNIPQAQGMSFCMEAISNFYGDDGPLPIYTLYKRNDGIYTNAKLFPI